MDSGNSQPNLSGNGQPIVSGGSQFGNQPQQSQPVIQTPAPQQPVPQMQGPISSGGGDIVLPTSEKKSKKGLIIGIVVGIVTLVIVIIVVLFFVNNENTKKESVVSDDLPVELVESFNSFVNYLVFGLDSDEEPDFIGAADNLTISEKFMYTEPSEERDAYFAELLEKYSNFSGLYDDLDRQKPVLSSDVMGFYYDIAGINKIETNDMLEYYNNNGLEKTISFIESRYPSTSNSENANLYIESWKEFLISQLPLYQDLLELGCVNGTVIDDTCAGPYIDSKTEAASAIESYHQSVVDGYGSARAGAYSTMMELYDYFYPSDMEVK
jgi:hypothetical protein